MWVLQCLVGRGQSSHWLSFSPSTPGAPGIEFRSSDLVAGILTCLTLSLVHRFSPVGGTLYHQGSQNHRCEQHIGNLLNSCGSMLLINQCYIGSTLCLNHEDWDWVHGFH